MYDLPHHKEKNEQVIKEFIAKYPFAFLSGCDTENKPVATQVPVFIEEKDGRKILRGHIMKNTDHHKAFVKNENVLVVFTGHHIYVSGTWYSNPYTPSTWNYMSVHAKGTIRFLDDAALIDALRMTTLYFENNNQDSTTIYDNLPPEYTQRLMKAIVAFEIEVKELDTVFKLSQDRDEKSYEHIMERLREKGEAGQVIAAEMEKRKREVFHGGKKYLPFVSAPQLFGRYFWYAKKLKRRIDTRMTQMRRINADLSFGEYFFSAIAAPAALIRRDTVGIRSTSVNCVSNLRVKIFCSTSRSIRRSKKSSDGCIGLK